MGSSPRQLAWKDKFVWELTQTVLARFDSYNDFADRYIFPDMTTPVPFVLYLSQTEWTQLYSAVLTGADLTFPNDSHNTELLFLQTVGLPMAQLCAAVANCIGTSDDVEDSIYEWLKEHGYGAGDGNPPVPLPPTTTGTTLLPPGYECTNDNAFGMALAVVNSINEATTEVLQAIEILTNPLELAAEMADNIPGAAVLTVGLDVAAWIQDTAAEGYELAWSSAIRDELACTVWCSLLAECDLSFDTLWGIYLEESGIPPPVETDLVSWLEWLIDIAFGADKMTVATVSLLGLIMMRYGTQFGPFSLGIYSLEMVIKLSADETDSDWDILCSGCETWCSSADLTLIDGGWIPDPVSNAAGVWTDGVGWESTDIIAASSHAWRAVRIEQSFTNTPVNKLSVVCDFDIDEAKFDENNPAIIFITEDSSSRTDVVSYLRDDAPQGTDITIEWEGSALDMDYIKLFFRSSLDSEAPYDQYGGTITLKSVQICGTGTKPPELP